MSYPEALVYAKQHDRPFFDWYSRYAAPHFTKALINYALYLRGDQT